MYEPIQLIARGDARALIAYSRGLRDYRVTWSIGGCDDTIEEYAHSLADARSLALAGLDRIAEPA
jgi:hypothetical protein